MLQERLDELAPCDSVYVGPHALDLALSCAGRLLHESRQGLKLLVVTLFGPGLGGPFGGDSHCAVEMPEARRRSPLYASYAGLLEARDVGDEAWAGQTAELLTEIGHRTKAKQ